MTFGSVVAAVIVGVFAAALIAYALSPACMFSIGGTCLVRGEAPAVTFLRKFEAANRSPRQANANADDYTPISSAEFQNCSDDQCRQSLCEVATQHGQFQTVSACMEAMKGGYRYPPADGPDAGSWSPPAAQQADIHAGAVPQVRAAPCLPYAEWTDPAIHAACMSARYGGVFTGYARVSPPAYMTNPRLFEAPDGGTFWFDCVGRIAMAHCGRD